MSFSYISSWHFVSSPPLYLVIYIVIQYFLFCFLNIPPLWIFTHNEWMHWNLYLSISVVCNMTCITVSDVVIVVCTFLFVREKRQNCSAAFFPRQQHYCQHTVVVVYSNNCSHVAQERRIKLLNGGDIYCHPIKFWPIDLIKYVPLVLARFLISAPLWIIIPSASGFGCCSKNLHFVRPFICWAYITIQGL